MRRLITLAMPLALAVAVLLSGCALPGTGQSGPADPADDPVAPETGVSTPAVPMPGESTVAEGALGDPVTAGPWTLVVREAEFGDAFGALMARESELVRLDIALTNSSAADLAVTPSDFLLSDGTSSTLPVQGDPALTPEALLAAGETVELSAVYAVAPEPAEGDGPPLSLLFQPAEGDPVTIEVSVR